MKTINIKSDSLLAKLARFSGEDLRENVTTCSIIGKTITTAAGYTGAALISAIAVFALTHIAVHAVINLIEIIQHGTWVGVGFELCMVVLTLGSLMVLFFAATIKVGFETVNYKLHQIETAVIKEDPAVGSLKGAAKLYATFKNKTCARVKFVNSDN